MSERLEAIFALIDQVTGPSKSVNSALKGVEKTAKGLSIDDVFDKVKSGAGKAVDALKAVGAVALKVGAAILGIAAAATAFGMKAIIEATEGKKKDLASLGIVDGGEAGKILDDLKAIANAGGLSADSVTEMYKALRLSGQSADVAKESVKALADVGAVGGDAAQGALQELLKETAATGEFKIADRELKNLGIPESAIFDALRSIDKYAHMTNAQLDAAMKSGKISAEDGTKATLDAVNAVYDKGGGLGKASKDIGGGSIGGQIQALKNTLSGLVKHIDLTPIINAFKTFGAVLSGPAGAAAVKAIGEGVGYLMTKLSEIATPENITAVIDTLTTLGRWIGVAVGWLEELGHMLIDAFKSPEGQEAIAKLTLYLKRLWAFAESIPWKTIFSVLIDVIVWVVSVTGTLLNGFLDLLGWCSDNFGTLVAIVLGPFFLIYSGILLFWDEITSFFSGLWDALVSIGSDIVNGIWEGITSAWAGMLSKFSDLVELLPDSVKAVLGIASPSKVGLALGYNFGESIPLGAADALNDNAGGLHAPAVSFPQPSSSSSGGGGPSITIGELHVHVTAGPGVSAADAEAQGAAIARGFRAELADSMEDLATRMTGTG